MMNGVNTIGYFAKEVALKVDINTSTLRQWCLAMEKLDYTFERNDKEQRIFYESDINMFFEVKREINKTRNRDNAIKTVVSRYLYEKNSEKTSSVRGYEHDNVVISVQELERIIERSVNRAIENEREIMLEGFERRINNAIEQSDLKLVNQVRKKQNDEEQKYLEIAATSEVKQSFFSKWFRKN